MQTYFYRIDEFVKTFGRGESREESFTHSMDFKFDTVKESRQQAYAYYRHRLDFLQREGEYFLPFSPVKDSGLGLIAVYTLVLYFVECYNEDEYYLHGLEGVQESEATAALEVEEEVLGEEGEPVPGLHY